MTSRLRPFLSRVCSARTMERIVDPVLTDIEAEPARARWAGYFDLARALALNTISTTPRQWLGNDVAVLGRLVALSVLFGLLTALVMNVAMFSSLLRRPGMSSAVWLLWLLPSAFTLTIPGALLIAVPVALKGRVPDTRLIKRALGLALLYAAALFLWIGWVVPASNQSFRTAVVGRPVPPGAGERSFAEIRRDIGATATFRGGEQAVRRLEFSYHSRLALVLTPVSVMLLALALARRTKTTQHPYRTGILALLGYAAFVAFTRIIVLINFRNGDAPPIALAWGPYIALGLCGALALYFSAIATPAKRWTTLPPPGSSNDLIS